MDGDPVFFRQLGINAEVEVFHVARVPGLLQRFPRRSRNHLLLVPQDKGLDALVGFEELDKVQHARVGESVVAKVGVRDFSPMRYLSSLNEEDGVSPSNLITWGTGTTDALGNTTKLIC